MKLDEAELTAGRRIFAINGHLALNQTRVQTMSNWKGLAVANAARNGVFAATLAREGSERSIADLRGRLGFFKRSPAVQRSIRHASAASGRPFRMHDCAVKFYPAQAFTQTAIAPDRRGEARWAGSEPHYGHRDPDLARGLFLSAHGPAEVGARDERNRRPQPAVRDGEGDVRRRYQPRQLSRQAALHDPKSARS